MYQNTKVNFCCIFFYRYLLYSPQRLFVFFVVADVKCANAKLKNSTAYYIEKQHYITILKSLEST